MNENERRYGEIMTPEEAAEYLRVSIGSIYQRVNKGQIPYFKMGRLLRFRRLSLEAYIKSCE
jgi:excisionase family DNA binding protein